jgi:hypothetical protein
MLNKLNTPVQPMFNCRKPFYHNKNYGWRVLGMRFYTEQEINRKQNPKMEYHLWEENFDTEEQANKYYETCHKLGE